MYESFYGLTDKPFSLTPNPRFVFYSQRYREAEGQLLYGINNREGFMLVTGEPGTGKTTLCRDLLEKLDHSKVRSALIFNPFLNAHEMLAGLLTEFGVTVPPNANRKELLDRLNQFLLAQLALGKSCVAIFDEAQHLSSEFLEQIRVLSNLETDVEKLLQIILVGQPELLSKIRTAEMSQLDQRVSIRCRLTDLDENETDRYIHHRLNVAGARGQVCVTPGAVTEIYKASGGVPRLINLICDRALLAGFVEQTRDITATHIRKAVQALRGEEPDVDRVATHASPLTRKRSRRPWVAGLAIAGVVAIAALAAALYYPRRVDPVADAEALYTTAATAASAADGESAFNALLTKYPQSHRTADALLGLARYRLARGDRTGALEAFQQVLSRFPQHAGRHQALVSSALVQLELGDSTAACATVARADSAAVRDPVLRPRIDQLAEGCGLTQVAGGVLFPDAMVDSAGVDTVATTADIGAAPGTGRP